jgi:ABC-type dipeptide/oligopeptide/nickel transport system ATPase component
VIADEPTSALDSSVQAEILLLLRDLGQRTNSALLVISHNPAMLAHMVTRVLVMQAGRIVEQGEIQKLFARPQHAFTQQVMQAARELMV